MEIFDTDVNPTKREELIKIIKWAAGKGDEAESQSLELKSQLSFESAGGARNKSFAKIIKFILGASNRDEYKAAKAFQGYGVMLIGVGEGEIVGIESALPEEHEFREHAKAYFGPTVPKFEYFPVDVDGKKVLTIVVDPPKNGQPIYICSKDFSPQDEKDKHGKTKKGQDALRDGAVYYRESSSTKAATSDQLRELFERYKSGKTSLAFNSFGSITSYSFDREIEEEFWADSARDAINDLVKKNKNSSGFELPRMGLNGFYKTVNEQVEEIRNWRSRWNLCVTRLMEHVAPTAYFQLENTGTVALSNVKVELTFPMELAVYAARDQFDSEPYEINPAKIDKRKDNFHVDINELKTVDSGREICGDAHKVFWNVEQVAPGETVTSFSDLAVLFTEYLTSNDPIEVSYRITGSELSEPVVGHVVFDVFGVGHPVESLMSYGRKRRLG